MDNIIRFIKNSVRSLDRPLNDKANPAVAQPGVWLKQIESVADAHGVNLTSRQLAALRIPNTEASLNCYAWMNTFFDTVGDKEPDRLEIHLDAQPVRSIHMEYQDLMKALSQVRSTWIGALIELS